MRRVLALSAMLLAACAAIESVAAAPAETTGTEGATVQQSTLRTATPKPTPGKRSSAAKKHAPEKPSPEVAAVSSLRTAAGLSPVHADPVAMRAARTQAQTMAKAGTMSHDIGGSFSRRMDAAGMGYGRSAENIGEGYTSFREMLDGWMASPGHRRNLLMPKATRVGIASARGPDGRLFWALVIATTETKPPTLDQGPLVERPRKATADHPYRWGNPLPLPFGLSFGD